MAHLTFDAVLNHLVIDKPSSICLSIKYIKLNCVLVRIVAGAIRCEGARLNMFGDTTFVNNAALDGSGGETKTTPTSCHAWRHKLMRTGHFS